MGNKYTVATVSKASSMKTKEMEQADKSLTDLVTEVTQTAYLVGYKDALVNVRKSLPTNTKTIDIIKLKVILGLAIKNCEEKEDD